MCCFNGFKCELRQNLGLVEANYLPSIWFSEIMQLLQGICTEAVYTEVSPAICLGLRVVPYDPLILNHYAMSSTH